MTGRVENELGNPVGKRGWRVPGKKTTGGIDDLRNLMLFVTCALYRYTFPLFIF
jgi:hypothetical protein